MEEGTDLQFLSSGEAGLTRLACPECGGALAEAVLPHITCFRCHVGHQFGPQSLAAAQAETAEAKVWAAVVALEETAVMALTENPQVCSVEFPTWLTLRVSD